MSNVEQGSAQDTVTVLPVILTDGHHGMQAIAKYFSKTPSPLLARNDRGKLA